MRRDERLAGVLAGRAAASLGYRSLVWYSYFNTQQSHHFSRVERFAGLKEAAKQSGVEIRPISETPLTDAQGVRALGEVMRQGELIVADSIYQSRIVRTVAEGYGYAPGHHFGLICTDDAKHLNRYWPSLTRVRFDRFEMGLSAAEMLRCMLDRESVVCESKLRSSSLHPGNTAWGPRPARQSLLHPLEESS